MLTFEYPPPLADLPEPVRKELRDYLIRLRSQIEEEFNRLELEVRDR